MRARKLRSLKAKVMAVYLLVMVLPLLLVSGFFIAEVQREADREWAQLLDEYTLQVERSLELVADEISRLGALHDARYDILLTLRKDYARYPDDLVADARAMADWMGVALSLNNRIYRLTYVGRYGQVFAHFSPPYLEDRGQFLQRIDALRESDRKMIVFPAVKSVGGEDVYIPIVMKLRDPHTGIIAGYAGIDMLYSEIDQLFSGESQIGVLLISGGHVIYDSAIPPADVGKVSSVVGERVLYSGDAQKTVKIDGTLYNLRFARNAASDWRVVVYSANAESGGYPSWRAQQYVLLCGLLVLITALFGGRFFTGFVRQLNVLRSFMHAAREGDIALIGLPAGTREMRSLYDSYNNMACRITESVKREYEMRLLQKKTEMDMLLLQINPHFLYNTLNLVRSIAQCSGLDEIDRISLCLSGILRYSLESAVYVALEEELRQVSNYITIQQFRFPGMVYVEYKVDPSLRACRVVKFILQPIVENAFRHALEKKKGDRRLIIEAAREDGAIAIAIYDNGMGMEPSVLKALQAKIESVTTHPERGQKELAGGESDSTGIGLINVHKRLIYAYGRGYGIWVESVLGEGTAVTLRLPIRYGDLTGGTENANTSG